MPQQDRLPRICIFCGSPPEDRSREHPLPQWLLALTGEPSRVVNHGVNWETGKPIRYAFDSFVFPACAVCNGAWSETENSAKGVVQALCRKEGLSPQDYILLLDWLDKVRVGLWLGHRYLQQNPMPPNFAINSRVGTKDRMLAIYPVGDHQRGLNVYGAETPLFQYKPSVFGLRINNILLLNASWDFMCAARCAFPYPQDLEIDVTTGLLGATNFRQRREVHHPPVRGIAKPCVLLVQPITHRPYNSASASNLEHRPSEIWPGRPGLGPLFRQLKSITVRIEPTDPTITFDSITGRECQTAGALFLQAYSLQNASIECERYIGNPEAVAEAEHSRRTMTRFNRRLMQGLRSITSDKYREIWLRTNQP